MKLTHQPTRTPVSRLVVTSIKTSATQDAGTFDHSKQESHSSSTKSAPFTKGNIRSLIESALIEDLHEKSVGDGASAQAAKTNARLNSANGSNPLFRYVFELLDGQIDYPQVFKERKMNGLVSAELRFLSDGSFDRNRSRIWSASPYLRVYVAQMIRVAFQNALPPMLLQTSKERAIKVNVHFEITETTSDIPDKKSSYTGNFISIFRQFPWSKLQWQLGPLAGLAPLPAVGIDLSWFTEKLPKIIQGREEDPLAIYRLDPEWNRTH